MRKASLAVLALALCWAGQARADQPRSVALAFDGCGDADVTEIRRLVAIDFGVAAGPDAAYAVQVMCRDDTWQLSVAGSTLSRTLDFAATAGSARARLTAIVVGELVAEASAEREARPTAPPEKPIEPPSPAVRAEPPAPARERFRISLLGTGRTLLGGVPRLLGGAVRFEDLRLPWALDVLGEQGAVSTSRGVVSLRSLSAALSVSLQQSLGSAQVRAGVGFRAGAVWMQGVPSDASQADGLELTRGWAGPLLSSALALRLPAHFAFVLVLEGGYTVWSVYGLVDAQREAALSGVWLGAGAGLGFSL